MSEFRLNNRSIAAYSCAALLLGSTLAPGTAAAAADVDPIIAACLTAFGEHPFSDNPAYRTLPVKVKVFGIGKDSVDDVITTEPALVYIKTGVNVMGGTVVHLKNPRGWYCMRPAVNVMGGFTIKLACDAHFAVVGQGTSVMSNDSDDSKATTVMGSTTVERDCSDTS